MCEKFLGFLLVIEYAVPGAVAVAFRESEPEDSEEPVLRLIGNVQLIAQAERLALDDTVLSWHFHPRQYGGPSTCASGRSMG